MELIGWCCFIKYKNENVEFFDVSVKSEIQNRLHQYHHRSFCDKISMMRLEYQVFSCLELYSLNKMKMTEYFRYDRM